MQQEYQPICTAGQYLESASELLQERPGSATIEPHIELQQFQPDLVGCQQDSCAQSLNPSTHTMNGLD